MATTKVRYNQIKTGLPAGGDMNYNNVSLLLNMEGSNGSTTFTDSSSSGHSVTANGNASISTSEFKFGGSSYYNNNDASSYLSVPNSVMNFGTEDFTIECWVRISTAITSDSNYLMSSYSSVGDRNNSSSIGIHKSGGLIYYTESGGTNQVYLEGGTSGWSADTWYHIAATRNGSTFRIFKDGVIQDSSSYSGSTFNGSQPNVIGNGHFFNTDGALNGYIDQLRVTKGLARYTSNFSVPTAAFPAFESKEGKRLIVNANESIELES